MKILVIRHAEPDYENNTLTRKGFREAQYLLDKLCRSDVSHIYSSPLNRALYTAKPLAEAIDKKIEIQDWLTEFEATILLDNHIKIPWDVMAQTWQNEKEIYDINTLKNSRIYSSMNMPEKYDYVTRQFDILLEKHGAKRENIIYKGENNNDTIAIFCHFGTGMVLVSHLTGISPILLWQTMFLPTSSVREFVTEERVKGEFIFKCKQLGDTSHLYKVNEPVSNAGLYGEFYGAEGEGARVK